ncbi:MAG TPA: hypothetical protein VJA25_08800 [Dehalococcoidia bacterium]|nr:hypothetical protein [Dehalococcoidia bacterium]
MTACRAYWTCIGLLVAFNAMVWLTIANEVLRRADGPQGRSRRAISQEMQLTYLARGNIEYPNDGGATAYISERN